MKNSSDSFLEFDLPIALITPEAKFEAPWENTSPVRSSTAPRGNWCVVGALTGFDTSGVPYVSFPGNGQNEPLRARSIAPLSPAQIGNEVLLLFESDDQAKPIILGCIQSPNPIEKLKPVEVQLDGEKLAFTAGREIVLRCGKASITLTRAGKVLIRGAYLLTRSSGVNRIKGGSVQIN